MADVGFQFIRCFFCFNDQGLDPLEVSGGGSHCVIEISATWIRGYEYAADVSFFDLSNPPYSDDHDLSSENRRMP